jgi:hypothetical protein
MQRRDCPLLLRRCNYESHLARSRPNRPSPDGFMKLTTERPFASPEAASRKLIELAAAH